MKRLTVVLAALLVLGLASSALASSEEFAKGSLFLTPEVGINTFAIPFGLSVEYGITPNIGAGLSAMFQFWGSEFWSETLINLSADAAYHFTQLEVEKLDLFAGASLGFSIYSWKWKSGFEDGLEGSTGTSGLYLSPFLGARYFFNPKFAASLKAYFSIVGSWAGVGGVLGVTIRLK